MARTMNVSRFKEQCLALVDTLEPEGIVITKRGKPVAKIVPIRSECAHLIGALKGKISVHGNILSTGIRWNAES